jgi:hypothetical protein
MTYLFDLNAASLRAIVEHTTAYSETCSEAYTGRERLKPDTLYLVKDSGAYIMACTDPDLKSANGYHEVCYADGCRPEDGHIGGDDFVENIPAQWFRNGIKLQKSFLKLKVSARNIACDLL